MMTTTSIGDSDDDDDVNKNTWNEFDQDENIKEKLKQTP